ncbi:hypothetical protein AAG906_020962 [Vitis piasezkii]
MVTLLLEVNLLQMMLKGHGNDHNSNDPCILCKCASTRYIAPNVTTYLTSQYTPSLAILLTSLGLKVNLDKNELIPVGNVENVEELASELGCKVGSLPSTYLGMSLGAPFKSVAIGYVETPIYLQGRENYFD